MDDQSTQDKKNNAEWCSKKNNIELIKVDAYYYDKNSDDIISLKIDNLSHPRRKEIEKLQEPIKSDENKDEKIKNNYPNPIKLAICMIFHLVHQITAKLSEW